ncbi:MAG: glycosyltransferase family 4 protein [Methanomassiliicoccales archaeon]|nr:MAG: glycosyltransferase family 4 protein [Methanomassiliicoccales archaeon]
MKIVINAIPLLSERTGIGRYIYKLSSTLLQLDNVNKYYFFYGESFSRDLVESPRHTVMRLKNIIKKILRHPPNVSEWIFSISMQCKDYLEHFDIYHETNYIPLRFRGKIVTSVCDLSVVLFPETHPRERVQHFSKYFLKRLPWSNRIITLSDHVKEELVKHLGICPSIITTIPLAPDEKFSVLARREVESYLRDKGYPEYFILYVGAIEPRKNLKLLIRAFNDIKNEFNGKYYLVVVGPKGWSYEEDLKLIEDLGITERIVMPGYIPDGDLHYLYNGAKLFVFPSLYEGFGLPPLEAMACGVPVITSNCSSLPDVVADAGIMIDPYRVDQLTEAIHLVLSDEHMWQEMREKGLNRAKMFSWEKCARETLKVYEDVYNLKA